MTNISVHMLTAYPPSNPNRDEDGQPKSAIVGGVKRQRISSQCIKRAWRTSDVMSELNLTKSTRTRGIGMVLHKILVDKGVQDKTAQEWAGSMAEKFGKLDSKNPLQHKEMVVIGAEEWEAATKLARDVAARGSKPTNDELDALPQKTTSIDCAMFGRMRAADTALNVESSVSVSHSLTTGKSKIDNDFWTSVDDLKSIDGGADKGSGGMGDVEFGSGVYYTYVDINVGKLIENLDQNIDAARDAIAALLKAMATTTPGGHRSTFGHHGRASYLRVEIGESSGNLFCPAFEEPQTLLKDAIESLKNSAQKLEKAYALNRKAIELSVPEGSGSLSEIIATVRAAI